MPAIYVVLICLYLIDWIWNNYFSGLISPTLPYVVFGLEKLSTKRQVLQCIREILHNIFYEYYNYGKTLLGTMKILENNLRCFFYKYLSVKDVCCFYKKY